MYDSIANHAGSINSATRQLPKRQLGRCQTARLLARAPPSGESRCEGRESCSAFDVAPVALGRLRGTVAYARDEPSDAGTKYLNESAESL